VSHAVSLSLTAQTSEIGEVYSKVRWRFHFGSLDFVTRIKHPLLAI